MEKKELGYVRYVRICQVFRGFINFTQKNFHEKKNKCVLCLKNLTYLTYLTYFSNSHKKYIGRICQVYVRYVRSNVVSECSSRGLGHREADRWTIGAESRRRSS
jgi:hypothetical protein